MKESAELNKQRRVKIRECKRAGEQNNRTGLVLNKCRKRAFVQACWEEPNRAALCAGVWASTAPRSVRSRWTPGNRSC